jgi:hypothetical protein
VADDRVIIGPKPIESRYSANNDSAVDEVSLGRSEEAFGVLEVLQDIEHRHDVEAGVFEGGRLCI